MAVSSKEENKQDKNSIGAIKPVSSSGGSGGKRTFDRYSIADAVEIASPSVVCNTLKHIWMVEKNFTGEYQR